MALSDNLVAYYKLEDVNDSTANGYNLTNNGTTTFTSAKIGNGMNGGSSNTTKYLTYSGNMGIAGSGSITTSAWINLTSATFPAGNQMTITSHRSTLTTDRYVSLFYAYNSGTPQLRLGEGGVATANYTITLTTGQWYHVVGVRDATNYTLYVNGIQVAQTGIASGTSSANGFAIGNEVTAGNNISQFSGLIDEVGVWSRALSADEISQIFNSGRGNQYPFTATPSLYGATHYYKLDESSGNASDIVGILNGTNTAITYSSSNGKINNGAGFNGSTSKIDLGSGQTMFSSAFTWNGWFYFNNFTTYNGLIAQTASNSPTPIDSYTVQTTGIWSFGIGGVSNGSFTSNSALSSGVWQMLTITYDGSGNISGVNAYVNGSAIAITRSGGALSFSNSGNVIIGSRGDSVTHLNGKADEIGLWSRALSQSEITSLYNSGNGLQYPFYTPKINYLVVGGGGGGGFLGGGGGGGGFQAGTTRLSSGSYPIVVGTGGSGGNASGVNGTTGNNSTFASITGFGGGGGGSNGTATGNGLSGGNGGGAAPYVGGTASTGGSATQGFRGGNGSNSAPNYGGGGGGGAGAQGVDGTSTVSGAGGAGATWSINSTVYAGGGGSGGIGTSGAGGTGGGGAGASGAAGTAGTNGLGGGGGGAGNNFTGGTGGKGVVIVAYKTDGSDGVSTSSTGGTITTSGAYTLHTFTSDGTFTLVASSGTIVNSGFFMFM